MTNPKKAVTTDRRLRILIRSPSNDKSSALEASVDGPEGTGSRVSVVMEGDPGGFFKLAEPLVERAVRREIEGNLATLKDILETRG